MTIKQRDQVLHLVVPGLLGPMPRLTPSDTARRFPHLERWLARAQRRPVSADPDQLLFDLFDITPAAGDLPSAALCYLADTGRPPSADVYLATPVHLRPDQDRLLLFDNPADDMSPGQAAGFVAAFNAHFDADGWRLEAPVPERWYLHLAGRAALRTSPLAQVVGRNVDLFLPQGPDAGAWRQRLNEVQMLFHTVPANAEREAAGLLPVNSLWLHGGGRLPDPGRALQVRQPAPPMLQGLSRLGGRATPEAVQWLGDAQRAVIDVNPQAWLAAVARLDTLLPSLPPGSWLYPGNGQAYRWSASRRWCLWQRPRSLVAYLASDDG